MTQRVPAIYTIQLLPPRISVGTRILALLIGMGCLLLLLVATQVSPDNDGLGTHLQLGMKKCHFLLTSGLPCPTCGMTTSFSWFVRGHLLASIYVQPMGAALALAACAGVWAGLYIGLTGRPIHRLAQHLPLAKMLFGVLLFTVAAWGWKILLHLSGWDGWS